MSQEKEKERFYKIVLIQTDYKPETFEKARGIDVDPYTIKVMDIDGGLHYYNRQFIKKCSVWEIKPYKYGEYDEEMKKEIGGI